MQRPVAPVAPNDSGAHIQVILQSIHIYLLFQHYNTMNSVIISSYFHNFLTIL
jgi:hypothetical protein